VQRGVGRSLTAVGDQVAAATMMAMITRASMSAFGRRIERMAGTFLIVRA
jgi:hypothetical protein